MNRVNQATGATCYVSLSFKFDRSLEKKIWCLRTVDWREHSDLTQWRTLAWRKLLI